MFSTSGEKETDEVSVFVLLINTGRVCGLKFIRSRRLGANCVRRSNPLIFLTSN